MNKRKSKVACCIKRGLLSFCLSIFVCVALFSGVVQASGEKEKPENKILTVDDTKDVTVRVLNVSYDNNTYVSLRDVAMALKGTNKAFNVSCGKTDVEIQTGTNYQAVGGENTKFSASTCSSWISYNLRKGGITIDGRDTKYYIIIMKNDAGKYDCFMCLSDLAMILDANFYFSGSDLAIDTEENLYLSMEELERDGFFFSVNSCAVGDATTGQIFYSYMGDLSVAMASTTKLMTYLVVKDALATGEITMSDKVYASEEAVKLSVTDDGVIPLTKGQVATMDDLLKAMLLPSSNECSLMLAEHVAGSEAAFVERMNEKAKELGLSEGTFFYNCNGLPVYYDTAMNSKCQNHITSEDMFRLAMHILNTYPEVTEITSLKSAYLESFKKEVNNTNPTLYNMEGVVGLKTGTTNMARYCLVSAMPVMVDGEEHMVVAVEYGGEAAYTRGNMSELLLRYGKQALESGAWSFGDDTEGTQMVETIAPAESLVRQILQYLRRGR